MIQTTFKRYEQKYLMDAEQKEILMQELLRHMHPDEFGKSDILSLYYDTPDGVLARRSIERPVYKEKLRVRSYGVPGRDGNVFVELKKKYKGVVYKRRVMMKESEAAAYLAGGAPPKQTQITREMDYFLSQYEGIAPAKFVSYKRRAYYGNGNPNFRVTFDKDILWRPTDLMLSDGIWGERLLEKDKYLMEVKVPDSMPIWLARTLSGLQVYKTTFSKYGNAYLEALGRELLTPETPEHRRAAAQ